MSFNVNINGSLKKTDHTEEVLVPPFQGSFVHSFLYMQYVIITQVAILRLIWWGFSSLSGAIRNLKIYQNEPFSISGCDVFSCYPKSPTISPNFPSIIGKVELTMLFGNNSRRSPQEMANL